jgi:hypothetical protein
LYVTEGRPAVSAMVHFNGYTLPTTINNNPKRKTPPQ